MSHRLLMCRPSAYDLRYEINAWMHLDNRPDRAVAMEQWEELFSVLTDQLEAEIQLIPQASECPDMVFTANAGLLSEGKFILSRFKHKERQLEEPFFRTELIGLGFEIAELQAPPGGEVPFFEGEGDALRAGGTLVTAYGQRTELAAHEQLSTLVTERILPVQLIDSRWYHLDTCFLPLTPTTIAFYPGAFAKESVEKLRSTFRTIEIDEDEALRFGCNAVVIDRSVVLPANCPKFCRKLEQEGFACYSVPMTEFIKTGGACKCLTLYI